MDWFVAGLARARGIEIILSIKAQAGADKQILDFISVGRGKKNVRKQ
jgi:hypothetical protein